MTKRNFLKNEALKSLSEKLKDYDFKLVKSDDSFIQKTEFGWKKFSTTFLLKKSEGWNIRPGLLVRFDVVEDLYHQVSGFEKKYHKGTPTLGTSIEDLNIHELETRFDLIEERQIDPVVNELFKLFKSVAIPFFEKYDNLPSIDHEINDSVNSVDLAGSIFKGTKGLILAKLLDRKDFGVLQEKYQHYYENFSDGFYLPEYLKMKELLSSNDRLA